MDKILLVPPNSLRPVDKEKLEGKGYTVIETDEPEKIKLLLPTEVINVLGSDLFLAALKGANTSTYSAEAFTEELYARLTKTTKQ